MNTLSLEDKVRVVSCLVEGNSLRSTVRMTGTHRTTVMRILVELGEACQKYHDATLRNLKCQRVQCDEIWSFCYAKQKNVPDGLQGQFGVGDCWTWVAIDADTKLSVSWLVGLRTVDWALAFMHDVRSRLANRVQLTTDGHRPYLRATESAFDWNVDYAMLEKHYGTDQESRQTRYSPAKLQKITVRHICGHPDPEHISTSYAERQNLTMRMQMRRFTRLTNAFSKKVDNLKASVALHFMHYNFVRIHQTLRCTPAMAAGVADRVWTLEGLIRLMDES